MSESPPRVILHIGQHKTGTKALQYFLATHSDALATRGILYPLARPSRHRDGAYDISHYRLYALLRREILVRTGEALDASPASAEFWKSQRRFCDGHRSLRALLRAFEKVRARRGAHTLLLSAEDLFDMHTAHEAGFDELRVERGVELLAEAFRGMSWKPQIVLYLRRQDHLLAAHYAQFIVGSTINHSDFETFAQDFLPRLDFHALLAPWIRHFGAEAICVRPYESATLPAGVVHDFFDRVLGFLPPGSWHEPPCNPDFAHASPPRERVEVIRESNLRKSLGLPTSLPVSQSTASVPGGSPGSCGIAAWWTPARRRLLLRQCEAGNAAIAAQFLQSPALFTEPEPPDST